MDSTPRANRIHIAFFGLRNAGKSTLVNEFCNQRVSIVDETPGTTTDPVSKAMEILPLGPCLITDTAGLDDVGALGEQRVQRTLDVLATADIAVWVGGSEKGKVKSEKLWRERFLSQCRERKVRVFEYRRGESVEELKKKIASVQVEEEPGLLDGLVKKGDRVVCICPIDESAPKGRLILPQVQVIRACLDLGATCTVCRPEDLPLEGDLFITDSQAFAKVKSSGVKPLTSFSILFARQKGDLDEYRRGLAAIAGLKDGDTVLIAEGCTHHRQCNDIGTTKIPAALKKLSGRNLNFIFSSGNTFSLATSQPSLVVHCGACMQTRREMLHRIALCREAGVPIVNYGILLSRAAGVENMI